MIKLDNHTYKNTKLGKNSKIDKFVIIGKPSKAKTNKLTKIGKNAIIRSHSVLYEGNIIGDNFQAGHGVLIRENNKIGHNVSVGSHSIVEHNVIIGNNVRIHSNVFIPEFSTLKDNCWIGPGVTLTNAKYPNSPLTKQQLKGSIIESSAIIGANSTILPGITIGRKSLVGAGTVVTKNIPPEKIVSGNPGKITKSINQINVYSMKFKNK